MQKTTPQQLFFHRIVHPSHYNRPSISELPKAPLVIEPPNVQISNYTFDKISVVKLTLFNEAKLPRKFSVILPKRTSNFSIQCPEQQIAGKDSIELFIWFNPQKEKEKIEDQLGIKVEGQITQVHVPIVCYPKLTIGRTDSSKVLSSKDNIGLSQRFVRKNSKRRMASKNSIALPSGFIPSASRITVKDTRSVVVIDFQEKFKKVSEYVRQKYVKNEVYHGSKLLSKQSKVLIKQYHLQVMRAQQERLYTEFTTRYSTKYSSQGPISNEPIDCNVTWNVERNIPRITFDLAVGKIQEQVRKYVISMRFQRIQRSLKYFQDYRQRQDKLGRTFKISQYIGHHSQRVKESRDYFDLELQFDRSSVKPTFLPIEAQFKTFNGRIQITQRIGFDNWVPMNIVLPGYWETYGEKYIQIPAFYFHHEDLINDYRKGGSYQMHYCQPNETLSSSISNLLPIAEAEAEALEEQQSQFEDISDILRIIDNKDHKDYFIREDEEKDSPFIEEEAMQLGPLRSTSWRKQTYTSIDIFGLLKQDS